MKICWDNLEGIWLTENGNFRKGTVTYVYRESCIKCGEFYLTEKSRQSNFCGQSCASIGKTHTIETRKKLSIAKTGKNHPMYGKHRTAETKKKISRNCPDRVGDLNPSYKGGVTKLGLTTCDTYKDTLDLYETIRKQNGTEILEVKCAYCGQWFAPTAIAVNNRLAAINSLNQGECRFYCSENCKLACPTYGRRKYPKGFKHTTSREVNPHLRQMVFERDNWTCQICGKTIKEVQLHCHHMDPVGQNPMFQNDIDSCITLCKKCHGMVHSRRGCRYVDLQCNRSSIAENREYPKRHS